MRLPVAPPNTSARPIRASGSAGLVRTAKIPMATSAASAIPVMSSGLNGMSTAFSNPKAAPVLRTWVKSSSCGTMLTLSCSGRNARTRALVT